MGKGPRASISPPAKHFKKIKVDPGWLKTSLKKRIAEVDWKSARRDVERFVPLREQEALNLWGREFFLHHLALLVQRL